MNSKEMITSGVFLGVAVVVIALACTVWMISGDAGETADADAALGDLMFAKFDPAKADSLRIIRVDSATGEWRRFEIAKTAEGDWVIPTHGNYPADAEEQLTQAATLLGKLEIKGVASEIASEQEIYGVVEPTNESEQQGKSGIGTLVEVRSGKKTLAALIIGEPVEGNESMRFVRRPNQRLVYVTEIDPAALKTDLAAWIKQEVLDVNQFDVRRLRVRNYEVVDTGRVLVSPSGQVPVMFEQTQLDATLAYDSGEAQWNPVDILNYRVSAARPGELQEFEVQLAENEELNAEKLNEVRRALGDFEIVSVVPRPKDLNADTTTYSQQVVEHMADHGFPFVIVGQEGNRILRDMRAVNGELHATSKDGVEYHLLMGDIAGLEEGSEEKLSRYVFIEAFVNEDVLPEKPTPPGDNTQGPPESGSESDSSPSAGDDEPAAGAEPEGPAAAAETEKDDVAKQREQREYERKLDEYNKSRQEAESKVARLNERFRQWYFVIADETFDKLHVGPGELIVEKEDAADTGHGIDSFRKLEEEGIEPPPAPGPGGPGGPGGFPGGPGGLPFGQ